MTASKTLPLSMVHTILLYAVRRSTCSFENDEQLYFPCGVDWMAGQVCHEWRRVALRIMYSTCHATIKEAAENITVGPLLDLSQIAKAGYSVLEHTSKVCMYVDCSDIFSGKAQHMLLSPRLSKLGFPHATGLELHVHNFGRLKLDCPKEAFVHAIGFCRRIKAMLPAAETLDMVYGSNYIIADMQFGALFQKFIKEMGNDKSKVTMCCSSIPIPHARPEDIHAGLTSLVYRWDNTYGKSIPLVHRNAASLVSLKVIHACTSSFDKLFMVQEQEHVTYPALQTLEIVPESTSTSVLSRQKFLGLMPFPALKRLNLQTAYPFADDVLFRGNSKTLHSLTIRLDEETALLLCSSGTFANRSYKRLADVRIMSGAGKTGEDKHSAISLYMQLVLAILPTVGRLRIEHEEIAAALVSEVPEAQEFKRIHSLHLKQEASLTDILRLLMVMPGLVQLEAAFSGLGREFKDLDDAGRLSLVESRYARLAGSSFSRLVVRSGGRASMNALVTSAVLLAAVCPRLKKVGASDSSSSSSSNAQEFNEGIGKLLHGTESYKKHAAAIKQLLIPESPT
ncbi:hypothetical protein GGI25_005932 [Coemansia spiralis]|uniref:Uncharacterized protein n=1 Tax=Coemansia spiralis TaxID=417178 RepID=A0A9W8G2C1_9FUNG|nr:hypothetical protein GGI25_005932 [Coemansia spiralis]